MSNARTPLPWQAAWNEFYQWWDVIQADSTGTTYPQIAGFLSEADAAFVARACNSHDALVGAMTDLVVFTAAMIDDETEAKEQALALEIVQNVALKNARAALAKATGEK